MHTSGEIRRTAVTTLENILFPMAEHNSDVSFYTGFCLFSLWLIAALKFVFRYKAYWV